jgi:mxaK protein
MAQALALAQAGQDDAALARYRSLYDHPALGLLARYNASNVLLRRALALREAGNTDQAYPMTELAKEGYREVLRREPGHRPARYNLERALRLNPELDAEDLATVAPEHAERAVTTMRSVSQGLP